MTDLLLRRTSRPTDSWQEDDFDLFDGKREVGRIYRVTRHADSLWFWSLSFQMTGRKLYGYADSLDEARVAFKKEYERWQQDTA